MLRRLCFIQKVKRGFRVKKDDYEYLLRVIGIIFCMHTDEALKTLKRSSV